MGRIMRLLSEFSDSSIFDIREVNSSFASGSLKVMYTGRNRNGSCISRDAVERALPTLRNVPIVCHWDPESKTIGGHDVDVVLDEDGMPRLRNLTEPCGVVPDHARFSFQADEDENGVLHEYLLIEGVLLWKRQDVFGHIMNDLDGRVKHSMEISVFDGKSDNDGYYHVNDFEFTALCLLETCEPCFEGSELEVYSASNFKTMMEQMMSDLRETFAASSPQTGIDAGQETILTEGGEDALEEKMTLLSEFGVSIDELDFSIEDFSVEELRGKLEEMKAASAAAQEANFALIGQIRDEIYAELEKVTTETCFGTIPRYCLIDFDHEAMELFCYDAEENWTLFGMTYAMNGDHVVIDFDSKKRKKVMFVDFDEGEQANPFAQVFTTAIEKYSANDAQWSARYQEAASEIETMNSELTELRQFRETIEADEHERELNNVLAQFEDLAGVEAFEVLRNELGDYSADALEEKCYAIRGRLGAGAKFSKEPRAPKLKVSKSDDRDDAEPYGGLFQKYGAGTKD